jgi:hypothetical protein
LTRWFHSASVMSDGTSLRRGSAGDMAASPVKTRLRSRD